MGLKQGANVHNWGAEAAKPVATEYALRWHEHGVAGAWVGRKEPVDGTLRATRRFAHIDIYPWHTKRRPGLVYVSVQDGVLEESWVKTVDEAKLWAAAIYALRQHD